MNLQNAHYKVAENSRMLPVLEVLKTNLVIEVPYLVVDCDDNLMSSIWLKGSFQPKEDWGNDIFQNSPYFMFDITPEKGKRYYETTDEKVTVELTNKHYKLPKMRKYTGKPEKVAAKIQEWIGKAQAEKT